MLRMRLELGYMLQVEADPSYHLRYATRPAMGVSNFSKFNFLNYNLQQ